MLWAGQCVMAQLAEWLLPRSEVCCSNAVIGQKWYKTFVYCQLDWKDENKEKVTGNVPFKKAMQWAFSSESCMCVSLKLFLVSEPVQTISLAALDSNLVYLLFTVCPRP